MNITDSAKQMIEEIFAKQNAKNIRVYSLGGGCCGPQVGLSLDEPKETDEVQAINGIQVAIDPEVSAAVAEVTLDKQESEQGAGFALVGGSSCC